MCLSLGVVRVISYSTLLALSEVWGTREHRHPMAAHRHHTSHTVDVIPERPTRGFLPQGGLRGQLPPMTHRACPSRDGMTNQGPRSVPKPAAKTRIAAYDDLLHDHGTGKSSQTATPRRHCSSAMRYRDQSAPK